MNRPYNELVADYLDNADLKSSTKRTYRLILKVFAKWVIDTNRSMAHLKRSDFIAFKGSCNESHPEATSKLYVDTVRNFFRYLEQIGEHAAIGAGIKVVLKDKSYKREHLTGDEVDAILDVIKTTTINGMRDFAIVNLMARTGFRCVEVARLRVGDLHTYQGDYYLRLQRKGDDNRTSKQGVTNKAVEPITRYLQLRGVADESESMFITHGTWGEHAMDAAYISKMIHRYMLRANISTERKSAHSLRHFAAVSALKCGVHIREIQLMLGHRSVNTTELYLQSYDNDLRMKNPAAHAIDDVLKKR